MLLDLNLENFKRHERLHVDFTAGLNVIMGANYKGKSSILHGILFAFFGATAVPCKAESIPRRGSSSFRVTLRFQLGDDVWRIVRTKSKDELHNGDDIVAAGKAAVAAKVEKLLGMSQQQFLRLMYAEQKKAESLVSLGSSELNKTIEEVAGTSIVKDAITKLTAIMKTANDSADAIRSVLGEAPDLLAEESLENAMLAARAEVAAATGIHDTAVKAQQAASRSVQELRLAERTHQGLEQALQRAQDGVERCRAAVATAVAVDATELAEKEAQLADLTSQLAAIRAEYSALKAGVVAWNSYQASLTALATEEAALKHPEPAPVESVPDSEMANSLHALNDATTNLTLAKAHLAHVEEAETNGVCTACKRPFENHDPVELQIELAQARQAAQACADVVTAAREAHNNLLARQQQYNNWERETERRTAAVEAFRQRKAAVLANPAAEASTEALKAVEVRGTDVSTRQAQVKAEKERLADALTERTQRLAALRAREDDLHAASAALQAHVFSADDLAKAVATEALAGGASFHAGTALEAARQAFTAADHALSAWRTAAARYEAQSDKLTAHEQRAGRAKKLRTFLQDNFDAFMSETWEGLLAMASHFTRQGTEGFISQILRSEDGKFEYIEEGEQYTVMGSASGAQRSLMGLSMQIAMSDMLPCPLPVLLLDEASADMDIDVSGALVTMLRNLGKQVIIVSHREMDAAVADNVIAVE